MDRKVYVIERGQYSDYSCGPIFSSRKAAEAAIAQMENKYGDESIAEWTVWDDVPAKLSWLIGRYDGNFRRVWGTDHAAVRKVWTEVDGPTQAAEAGVG